MRRSVVVGAVAALLVGGSVVPAVAASSDSGGSAGGGAVSVPSDATFGPANSGRSIAGTVTNPNGSPIQGVTVDVFILDTGGQYGDLIGIHSETPSAVATTTSAGHYSISTGLAPFVPYVVCFDGSTAVNAPPTGYLYDCYGESKVNPDTHDSQPVSLSPTEHRTGVDARLGIGAEISGTVTDEHGNPIADVGVGLNDRYSYIGISEGGGGFVFSPTVARAARRLAAAATSAVPKTALTPTPAETEAEEFDAVTDASGHYDITSVEPSPWTTVRFDTAAATGGSSTTGYLNQTYDRATSRPTLIPLQARQHVSVNAALDAAPPLPTGSISGVVRTSSGTPLAGITVEADYTMGQAFADFSGLRTATTDSSGRYTVSGLPDGGYSVCTDSGDATGGAAYSSACRFPSNIRIAGGDSRTGINLVPAPAATVAGRVTDSTGHGIEGVTVYVDSVLEFEGCSGNSNACNENNQHGQTVTAADGSYTVTGLATGRYDVCFDATEIEGFQSQCYLNQPYIPGFGFGGGNPVALKAGTAKSIDVNLVANSSLPAISGRITDTAGNPLGDVQIVVISMVPGGGVIVGDAQQASGQGGLSPGATISTTTFSGDGGQYAVNVPAGKVEICFVPHYARGGTSAGGFVEQCYNKITKGRPTTLTVPVAGVPNVNPALSPAGAIAGKVTSASGTPLFFADVEVFSGQRILEDQRTRLDGSFDIRGLPDGTYGVCVDPTASDAAGPVEGFAPACDGGVPWNLVTVPSRDVAVSAGHVTPLPTFTLAAGSTLHGTLTDSAGRPLSNVGVIVNLVAADDGDNFIEPSIAFSGSDGTYVVGGLNPGSSYYLCFDATQASTPAHTSPTGYASVCNGGAPNTGDSGGGTPVKSGKEIDVSFAAGGSISGRITDSRGDPLADADVAVFVPNNRPDGGGEGEVVQTYDDGTYEADALDPAKYYVCTQGDGYGGDNDALGYLSACWDSTGTAHPKVLRIAAGQARTSIDVMSPDAGGFSGRVTDSHGHPLAGVDVVAADSSGGAPEGNGGIGVTGADGTYLVGGLEPSTTVFACFVDEAAQSCYGSPSGDPRKATKFTVVGGQVTTGIDGVLSE